MEAFTLEHLDDQRDLQIVRVPVTELSKDGRELMCHIAELGADELVARVGRPWKKRKERLDTEDADGFATFVVAATLCDENRNFLAKTDAAIDALCDKLSGKSGKGINRLFLVADKLNAFTGAELEDITKN